MSENKNAFHCTYSAKQQEEIKRIRQKYVPQEESKLDQLRRLDAETAKPGTVAAILVGVIGTLLLGVGMCCTIVWSESFFLPGVIIGLIGIAGIVSAYPLYAYITRKRRKKIAPKILRLSDELGKE